MAPVVPPSISEPQTATYIKRGLSRPGMTGAGAVVVGAVSLASGVVVELALGNGAGAALGLAFLVASAAMASVVRIRAMATAVIAAPLLFLIALTVITYASGEAQGLRQVVLELATGLALAAPTLFGGTLLALGIALARLVRCFVLSHRLKRS